MTRVISVRLDPDDPTEAAALATLDRLVAERYSARLVITETLRQVNMTSAADAAAMLSEAVDQVSAVLGSSATELAQTVQSALSVLEAMQAQVQRLEAQGKRPLDEQGKAPEAPLARQG